MPHTKAPSSATCPVKLRPRQLASWLRIPPLAAKASHAQSPVFQWGGDTYSVMLILHTKWQNIAFLDQKTYIENSIALKPITVLIP